MNSTKIDHQKEMDQIIKSIFIFNESTTKSFLETAQIQEEPCIAIQGSAENSQFVENIQVYYSDDQGNFYEAIQYPLGDIRVNSYSFDNFRFTFDEIEEDDPPVTDEITIKVSFVDGEEFSFQKRVSDYIFFNKQLKKVFDEIKLQ